MKRLTSDTRIKVSPYHLLHVNKLNRIGNFIVSRHLSLIVIMSSLSMAAQTSNEVNQDIPDAVVKRVDPSVVAIQHERAVGSGLIVDPSGLIITNGHVVRGNDDENPMEPSKAVTVILNDERKFPAKVLGLCMNPDVALIKIDVDEPLPAVEFADSTKAQIGQKCFAVGTPMGLKRTFTSGILSNVDRTDLGTFTKVFQTDAAINPGNSGGPLFDRDGKVLGINTYASRGANSLGFTIPAHVVTVLWQHLDTYGRFRRADFPFFFTSEIYDELGKALQAEEGMLVTYVMPDTPVAKAGLLAGDIITAMDGKPVIARTAADSLDRNWEFAIREPGTHVVFTVQRGKPGQRREVTVKGTLEEDEPQPRSGRFPAETITHRYETLGLNYEELSRKHRVYLGLSDSPGVLATKVMPNSTMAEAGIRPGDIITAVSGQTVASISAFEKTLESHLKKQTKAVALQVVRKKLTIHTAVAPDYHLKGTRILVVAPGSYEYLGLILKELVSNGTQVTVAALNDATVDAGTPVVAGLSDVKAVDYDAIIFSDGEKANDLWHNQEALRLVKEALTAENVLAGIGPSTMVLVAEDSDLLTKKFTTAKEFSGSALQRQAKYTGNNVEKDEKLVTSTGFDRKTVRQFITTLEGVIRTSMNE